MSVQRREVRGERLEVRNGFTAFAVDFHTCGSDRSKRQEVAFYSFAHTFQNARLASCFLGERRHGDLMLCGEKYF